MRSYRELFGTPEFTPLFTASCAQVAGSTLTSLALGTLVYARTDSPLLSALSMFGPSFAQLVGATTLLSVADRVPPRAAMAGVALASGLAGLLLAVPGMPLGAMFTVVFALGVIASIGSGARFGILDSILPRDAYILGRSTLNIAVGVMQIAGFALGGVLLALVSPRGAILSGAALFLAAALTLLLGLTGRPPRAAGRPSLRATWRVNRFLLSTPARRAVYLSLWVPNGLVVGCEALFLPYDQHAAAVLYVAAALGMLTGDVLVGRFLPASWRERFIAPLRYLLAAPYLLFALPVGLPAAVVLATVASVGYAAGLLLQERLISLTGEEVRGQAFGLVSTGMMAMQAVGAAIAGLIAQFIPTGWAIAAMAVLSLAVTTALTPGLRLSRPAPDLTSA